MGVILQSEYMSGWPLYGPLEWGATWEEDRLSLPLRDALYAWEALFETHFGWDCGWDSEAAAQQYQAQAVALVERLRLELGPEIEVQAHLWPLGHPQAGDDPDQAWLVDYQGLTLDQCILSAERAGRPVQVLSPANTTVDAGYVPHRLNVLVDAKGTVQKLWAG
jgi:hypothetical protein